MPHISGSFPINRFLDNKISSDNLQEGNQYYFKTKPYNHFIYIGKYNRKLDHKGKIIPYTNKFEDVRSMYEKTDPPKFKKLTKNIASTSYYYHDPNEYEYFKLSKDGITTKVIDRSLSEILTRNVRESVDDQHSGINTIISECVNGKEKSGKSVKKGGRRKRQRTRKSRR
jgi:hypothetical protein